MVMTLTCVQPTQRTDEAECAVSCWRYRKTGFECDVLPTSHHPPERHRRERDAGMSEQTATHIAEKTGTRLPHHALVDLHAYVVPITPKMLKETLCVVQSGLHALERERPGYNAGVTIEAHLGRVQLLIDECDRMRPTGPDGKHGDRHTPDCGCTVEGQASRG